MSLKDQMEAAVKELTAAHETNRLAYRAALKASTEADAAVRAACDAASVTANELGAARKALEELNRNSPVVEASGAVGG